MDNKAANAVLHLMPRPKRFDRAPAALRLDRIRTLCLPAGMGDVLRRFHLDLSSRVKPVFVRQSLTRFRYEDEYRLHIRRDGVSIEASSAQACHNALLTLKQLVRNRREVPCGVIRDWPDVRWRGCHLDCKGGFPKLNDLYAFCQKLIDVKFNCFLIEYEDRFPYRCVPQVALKDSPTMSEWRRFLAFLRGQQVKVIPLVQTGGHLEFLLRHEAYSALRENGNVNEICLSNPAARALILRMLDEVMDLHEEDDIFHIGADETWHMGSCPTCEKHLKAGMTKLDIYVKHVSEVARHVHSRGFRPMMWCDMLWRGVTPEKVTELPKDTILAEWVYSGTRHGAPGCYWAGKYVSSDRYNELNPDAFCSPTVAGLDKKAKAFLGEYWPTDPKTGLGPVSPYIRFFQENGYEVWGMSATRAGEPGRTFGLSLKSRVENVILWAKTAKGCQLPGVIATSWSRSSRLRPLYGPWDGPWEAILAAAQQNWDSATRYEEMPALLGQCLYGADVGPEVETIIEVIDRIFPCADRPLSAIAHRAIERIRAKAMRGHEHLALLDLWARFQKFRQQTESSLAGLENQLWRIPRGMLPEKARGNRAEMKDAARSLGERIAAFKSEMRKGLAPYFRRYDLEEYLASRFEDLELRLKNVQNFLKRRKGPA